MYGEKEVVLPLFTGHVARGLLLHIVREVDIGTSGFLHKLGTVKPYSVTPLRFRSRSRVKEGFVLNPFFPCRVRFRLMKDEYAKYLLDFLQTRDCLLVFDTTFRIASLRVRCKTYEELEKDAQETDGFKLQFRSPPYLASLGSRYHWMFPDAVKVFSSLMRVWNLFSASRRFDKDEYVAYKEWLTRNVGVSEYELWTRMAVMRNKKAKGFVGWATYESDDLKSDWNRMTHTLARFAEYANIGGNRTGGFGVVEYVSEPRA